MRDGRSRQPSAPVAPGSSADERASQGSSASHAALSEDLARVLSTARPRLIRLACARGVSRDDAEDAVQETLLVAWRHLERLRSPERFDAWLDGICQHVSQHHVRREHVRARRLVSLSPAQTGQAPGEACTGFEGAHNPPVDLPDPEIFDPSEELHRQDLELLLDRALGYISDSSRALVELCYLEELPQREVAERMGLTLGALELRLHRTRRELRRILSATLHADAQALGLALDEDLTQGWRETREWCNFCGRQRLRGTFETARDGRINLRLRCPDCSPRFGGDVYSTGGMVPLGGTRSFRPAFKRLIAFLKRHYAQDYAQGLRRGWHACPSCRRVVPVRLVGPGHGLAAFPSQWRLVFGCPACGRIISPAAFATYWAHPQVTPVALQFIEAHPRWIMEPDALTSYDGQPAIRFRLADMAGRAQLTILSDAQTLQVLTLLHT
jgi:RNA polymerase sigma factor (sigma-70 family)